MNNKGFILEAIIRNTVPYLTVFAIGFGCGYLYANYYQSPKQIPEDHSKTPGYTNPYKNYVNREEDEQLRRILGGESKKF